MRESSARQPARRSARGRREDQAGMKRTGVDDAVYASAEESQHGRRRVALAEPAAEARGGDEAAPALAREGGADEARVVVRRDADEDLLHDLVRQRRGRPRGHDAWPDSEPPAAAGARVWWWPSEELEGGREVRRGGWLSWSGSSSTRGERLCHVGPTVRPSEKLFVPLGSANEFKLRVEILSVGFQSMHGAIT